MSQMLFLLRAAARGDTSNDKPSIGLRIGLSKPLPLLRATDRIGLSKPLLLRTEPLASKRTGIRPEAILCDAVRQRGGGRQIGALDEPDSCEESIDACCIADVLAVGAAGTDTTKEPGKDAESLAACAERASYLRLGDNCRDDGCCDSCRADKDGAREVKGKAAIAVILGRTGDRDTVLTGDTCL